jgi:hypothetical protein
LFFIIDPFKDCFRSPGLSGLRPQLTRQDAGVPDKEEGAEVEKQPATDVRKKSEGGMSLDSTIAGVPHNTPMQDK